MTVQVRYYTRSGNTETLAKAIAEAAGVALAPEEFHCRGSFGPLHKGRPNEAGRKEVAQFAKKVVGAGCAKRTMTH